MKSFFTYRRNVQFADTDMAGIVHFSKILCYVEEAEHAQMQDLGIDVLSSDGGFPKVHIFCDYRSPLRFGDLAEVQLELNNVGNKSLTWHFKVFVNDQISAKGKLVTSYVTHKGKSEKIPQAILTALSGDNE